MKVCALASGSSGNCFFIENDRSALIVDAGISTKQVLERSFEAGIDIEKVKGILITHEHTDHIKGLDVLARKLNVPIYATSGTINGGFLCSNEKLINEIANDSEFKIEDFKIRTAPRSHSASDPVSFLIENKKKKVSVVTDLGKVCKNTTEIIGESDFIFLEANHDVKMLEEGPYLPWHKKWVLSDKGHLSNMQAALCVLEHGKQSLNGMVLAHLSKINNTPQLAIKTFRNILKERKDFSPSIGVSLRDNVSDVVEI